MEHLLLENTKIHYPVGDNMSYAYNYIDKVAEILLPRLNFNERVTLWVRGSSGAILGALLAQKIGLNCIINHIKKSGENSHTDNCFSTRPGIHIILDDFVSSGETIESIYNYAKKYIGGQKIDYLIVNSFNSRTIGFQPNYVICNDSFEKIMQEYSPKIEELKEIEIEF